MKSSEIIIEKIIHCLKKRDKSHHTPLFLGNEKKYLVDCIKKTYVSYVGKFVDLFERKIANYTKSNFAVATSSGTSALHLLLNYHGIGKNDEVLVPSFTYVATVNPIHHCGADPNFVDIELNTLGVCPKKLEKYLKKTAYIKNKVCINKKTKKKIKALIAVHAHGFPCEITKLKKICKKYNLLLFEDAAEALGSFYKKKHLGTFGDAAILSFNGNKTITTGSGGAVLVKNYKIAQKLKHISTQAKIPSQIDMAFDYIGFNYRMSNVSAAIGCAQLEKINKILKLKRKNYYMYKNFLGKINNLVEIMKEPNNSKTNYWMVTIVFKNLKDRNVVLKTLRLKGYGLRSTWRPLHTLKIYKNCQKDNMANSLKAFKTTVNLPSSALINHE